jgi:trigger factor
LREVYRLVPPTDEELLKDLDMPDLDTLRADVRRRMKEAREHHERRHAEDSLVDAVVAANGFDIPARLVEQQVESRIAQHRTQAEAPPTDEAVAELRAKLQPDMEKGLRRLFVLEAIARKEKLFVTEDDLMAELRSIAERNQSSVEEVARYYQQQNLLPAMRLDLLETKVRNFLYENAHRVPA